MRQTEPAKHSGLDANAGNALRRAEGDDNFFYRLETAEGSWKTVRSGALHDVFQ
jgi:hypothetical protein